MGTVLNLLVPLGAPTAALAGAEQLSFDQIGGQTSPAVEHFLDRTRSRAPCAATVEILTQVNLTSLTIP